MGFLDPSIVNAGTVSSGTSGVALPTALPQPPAAVTSSIVTIAGVKTTVQSVTGSLAKDVSSTATNYLSSALQSITSTFSGSTTSLASTISGALSGIFKNTNIPTASTPTTKISDPIFTNLLSGKTPLSTAFKVSSLESGSQSAGLSGATSLFGSGSTDMTGTTLSTLLNRFNLDTSDNLSSTVVSSQTVQNLSGLFTTLSADTAPLFASISGVTTTNPVSSTSVANDLADFTGRSSSVSTALGGADLSGYFLQNSDYSLVDQDGTAVTTNQSGVDATTANAILSILQLAGCSTGSVVNYNSANTQASLFNAGLTLSAQNGMTDLVNSLLGCSQSSTPLGQQSLVNAFTASSGSQLNIAHSILGSIAAPTTLNTPTVTQSIITNPSLTSADITTLTSLFTSLGTSSDKVLSVPSASIDSYPVYDTSLMQSVQPSLLNGIITDDTMTNYLNGTEMSFQNDGTLSWV